MQYINLKGVDPVSRQIAISAIDVLPAATKDYSWSDQRYGPDTLRAVYSRIVKIKDSEVAGHSGCMGKVRI